MHVWFNTRISNQSPSPLPNSAPLKYSSKAEKPLLTNMLLSRELTSYFNQELAFNSRKGRFVALTRVCKHFIKEQAQKG